MKYSDEYYESRRVACRKLFEDFQPDLTGCRNIPAVLKILELAREGMFSKEIAKKIGKTPKGVQKTFRRYKFPSLQNFHPPLEEERQGWEGGVKMLKGYAYKRSKGHPTASKHGNYVAVHRLVVEEKIGRYLLRTEVVDHIDGDITNNHPENLRVFASNAEHLHHTLKGKCPKWSEEGKASLDRARRKPRRTWKGVAVQSTPDQSKTCADQ